MSNSMAAGINHFAEAIEEVDIDAETLGVASDVPRDDDNVDDIDVNVDLRKPGVSGANVSIVDLDNFDDVISGRKKSSLVRPGKLKHWQRRSVIVSERRNTLAVSLA